MHVVGYARCGQQITNVPEAEHAQAKIVAIGIRLVLWRRIVVPAGQV